MPRCLRSLAHAHAHAQTVSEALSHPLSLCSAALLFRTHVHTLQAASCTCARASSFLPLPDPSPQAGCVPSSPVGTELPSGLLFRAALPTTANGAFVAVAV